MGCEVQSMYVAPTDGGYRQLGHVSAYQRGYNDGRRGLSGPEMEAREARRNRPAFRAGFVLGRNDRETLGADAAGALMRICMTCLDCGSVVRSPDGRDPTTFGELQALIDAVGLTCRRCGSEVFASQVREVDDSACGK